MTTIAASLVKELRDATGAGMMDCKRALEETSGDFEAARRLLRERGMASAAKRAGRETTEGKVGYVVGDDHSTMAAVGCETEPVSNNEDFLAFAERVLRTADAEGEDAVAALEEERTNVVAKLGENIRIIGVTRMPRGDGEVIGAYTHPPLHKRGALVKVRGGDEPKARLLAMHIVAARPRYRTREEIPAEDIEAERAIYAASDEVASKPENVREKIVEGMLNKRFFAESVLGDQQWVHDTSKTVSQAMKDEGMEILDFVRYDVAE